MKKIKLTNGHKEILAAVALMLVGVIVILIVKKPPVYVEEKLKIGYTTTQTKEDKIVEELPPPTPEEIAQKEQDLVDAMDYITDDNLAQLLQRVIGFTRNDFDGNPPIHTQLMMLLLMVNNYDIRESDGLDAYNKETFFLDKKVGKSFLNEFFVTLNDDFEPVPEDLSSFIYYVDDTMYFRRLLFNSERTRISKSEEIEIDGEQYSKLHTITFMYDYMNDSQIVDLYECDVVVKKVTGSKYGYKIKSIENFVKLALEDKN